MFSWGSQPQSRARELSERRKHGEFSYQVDDMKELMIPLMAVVLFSPLKDIDVCRRFCVFIWVSINTVFSWGSQPQSGAC